MKAVVVETNVMVVANGKADHTSPDHVLACIKALSKARLRQVITIDSGNRFLEEYFRHMSRSGQPDHGDAFAKWLFEVQGYPDRCERVEITPKPDDPDNFEEFPDDPDLSSFDRSDRKFVAVALASSCKPHVLNASDTDWWIFHKPLNRHGVKIKFLCPDLMR